MEESQSIISIIAVFRRFAPQQHGANCLNKKVTDGAPRIRCLKLSITERREVIDMGQHERLGYLEAIRNRHYRARRSDKGKILDEFCQVCGYQRKYAIRLLGIKSATSWQRPGRTFTIRSTGVARRITPAMACNRSDVQQATGGCHAARHVGRVAQIEADRYFGSPH